MTTNLFKPLCFDYCGMLMHVSDIARPPLSGLNCMSMYV
jgi:hypothetical protein